MTLQIVSSDSLMKRILNEVKILQSVNHPNVIKLEDVIDTAEYLYIVLELAEGGELFDKIIKKTRLDEKTAKLHFFQIASAIQYLHLRVSCFLVYTGSESFMSSEHLSS